MKTFLALIALTFSCHAFADLAAPVTQVVISGRTLLADRNGMTVYTFDPDQPGISKCSGGCAREWPPVLLQAGEKVTAPFGTTKRAEGTTQLTYNNHPLYLYIDDTKSGEDNGDGLGGIWHVVTAP